MWNTQKEYFSSNYKCIRIDLWGHGESDYLGNEYKYSIESLSEDIIEVLNYLNIEKFIYVGLSVGGMIGTYLGINYSNRIEKLIIMDSFSGKEPLETKNLYFQMLDTIENLGYIPEPMTEIIAKMFFTPEEGEKKGQLFIELKNNLLNIKKENIKTIVALGRGIFDRVDYLENMKIIENETYFIVGDKDIPRPVEESKIMCSLVKNSKLFIVEKAGHISNIENSKDVNKYLELILND